MENLDKILADVVAGPSPKLHNAYFFATDMHGNSYAKAFGTRDVAGTTPITTDSFYWVASLTKLSTTLAVLIAAEKGLVTLDQNVRQLVPELHDLDILEGFDKDGKPQLKNCTSPITLRQLLSHSSGFAYDIMNPDLRRWAKFVGKKDNTFSGSYEGYLYPLVFEPGQGWAYGSGMDWAGRTVESVSGQDLESFTRTHIWEPLGMQSTTFRPETRPDLLAKLVDLAWRDLDGSRTKSGVPLQMPSSVCCGGVGLYSTPDDQAKLMSAILAHGGGIISQASWEEIWKPQIPSPTHFDAAVSDTNRCLFAQLWPDGETGEFALSSSINARSFAGRRSSRSANWQGMPGCQTWIDRNKSVAGLFISQVLPPGDVHVTKTAIALETVVYEKWGTQ